MDDVSTLEFFGTTTFRLRTRGLTIFHDAWLDKPPTMVRHLEIENVHDVDYIFISHAHFDHLPGSDRLALKCGATVIANCEAINCLRKAGIPEEQLIPVSGGERIPLFTREVRQKALNGGVKLAPGPPGSAKLPHPDLAAAAVHVWPSLHCLLPGTSPHDLPEVFDTGEVFTGDATKFECTFDITRNMKYGLFRLNELVPEEHKDEKMRGFIEYIGDREKNIMSHCDGGQLMYNVIVGDQAVLFNSHLGAYEGIMRSLEPKPDVAILGIAGRGNLNGRPFDGSAAEFARNEVQWLGEPDRIIWCLHDESPLKPFRVDTKAALMMVEAETDSTVIDLEYNKPYILFE